MKYIRVRFAAALATALSMAPSACQDGAAGHSSAIDPGVYVAVMGELADLRKFPPSGIDTEDVQAQSESLRAAILSAHGVTAPELLAFARTSGTSPTIMETLADQISTVTDSLATIRDSVRADSVDSQASSFTEPLESAQGDSVMQSLVDPRFLQRRRRLDSLRSTMKRPSR